MPDPVLFTPEAIDAETAEFNAQLEALLAEAPAMNTVPVEHTRRALEDGTAMSGPIVFSDMAQEREISGPAGVIPLRVFIPKNPKGIYLHIHGGGWIVGSARLRDPSHEGIASACSAIVISVDYRLAPEHSYPATLDDCEAAAVWVVENAKSEFGMDQLVIGGESAGGHLAATTLIRMRDKHDFTGFSGANLVYGVYDLSMTPSQRNWGERGHVLNTPIMSWYYDNFVPAELRRDPDVSPLYADLSNLPPALFTIGTLDMLLDDTLFMHARWAAAGNEAELAVYPGGQHGFDGHPTKLGQRARQKMNQAIATYLKSGN